MSRRFSLALVLAGLGAFAPTAQAAAADIEVMTQNQYLGFDLLGISGGEGFDQSVIDGLKTRAASLPKERTVALAKLISSRMPALVALEEAYEFTCYPMIEPGVGCNDPEIAGAFTDQLDDTLAALGGKYKRAAEVVNFDLPRSIPELDGAPGIPITYKGRRIYIGVLDRDVILARSDVSTTPLPFQAFCLRPSATSEGCNYAFVAEKELAILGTTVVLKVERGFVGVTAMVSGQPYKFVATHLETRLDSESPYGRIYQSGQSAELLSYLQGLAALPLPGKMIVAGDFNSDPRDQPFTLPQWLSDGLLLQGVPAEMIPYLGIPPYLQLASSGFTDAWTMRPGAMTGKGAPLVGFSCCQDPDLANQKSALYERIDLIWSLTKPTKVQDARLLGESISDKTQPIKFGVWPSDHASVAAKLSFGR
jgi:hypothetical protein